MTTTIATTTDNDSQLPPGVQSVWPEAAETGRTYQTANGALYLCIHDGSGENLFVRVGRNDYRGFPMDHPRLEWPSSKLKPQPHTTVTFSY